jgi:hypothetical protein
MAGIPVNGGKDLMMFNSIGGSYLVPNPNYQQPQATVVPAQQMQPQQPTINTGPSSSPSYPVSYTPSSSSTSTSYEEPEMPSFPQAPSVPAPQETPASMDALDKVAMPAVDKSGTQSMMASGGSGGGGGTQEPTAGFPNVGAGMLRPMATRRPPQDSMALAGLGRKAY